MLGQAADIYEQLGMPRHLEIANEMLKNAL